jgi:hypothetical protein
MERMTGIEPALPAWEAGVLPLNHIRIESALKVDSNIIQEKRYFVKRFPGKSEK